MKLGRKQEVFAQALALLIQFAQLRGYTVRIGEVERSKDEARRKGFENSNHTRRLAADIHLFDRDGRYLAKSSDHFILAAFWESLSGDYDGTQLFFVNGISFNDGNHYAIKHGKVS